MLSISLFPENCQMHTCIFSKISEKDQTEKCYCSSSLTLLPPANEVWGKVIFSEACVKNSVHRRGVPGQVHPPDKVHPRARYTPQAGTPPRAGTSLDQVHPRNQVHPPGPGTPHPPGPGTLHQTRYTPHLPGQVHPRALHAGRYGQQAGSTHPTGMHSCFFLFTDFL